MKKVIACFLAVTLLPAIAAAQVYKCKSADGKLVYQQTPCPTDQSQERRKLAKPPTLTDEERFNAAAYAEGMTPEEARRLLEPADSDQHDVATPAFSEPPQATARLSGKGKQIATRDTIDLRRRLATLSAVPKQRETCDATSNRSRMEGRVVSTAGPPRVIRPTDAARSPSQHGTGRVSAWVDARLSRAFVSANAGAMCSASATAAQHRVAVSRRARPDLEVARSEASG